MFQRNNQVVRPGDASDVNAVDGILNEMKQLQNLYHKVVGVEWNKLRYEYILSNPTKFFPELIQNQNLFRVNSYKQSINLISNDLQRNGAAVSEQHEDEEQSLFSNWD